MAKVSVIIPVYNTGKQLAKCLDSVLGQTLSDIEVVCINDGSTDNSLEVMARYAARDSRVHIISQENAGAAMARNAGLDAATGEYIGFVDSDDYIDAMYYEKLYTAAKSANSDVAKAQGLVYNLDGTVRHMQPDFEDMRKNRGNMYYSFTLGIYRKDFLNKYGIKFLTDMLVGEDGCFAMDACLNANRIELADGVFYHYVRLPNSLDSEVLSDEKIRALVSGGHRIIDMINDAPNLDTESYAFIYSKIINYLLGDVVFCTNSLDMHTFVIRSITDLYKKCKYPEICASSIPDYIQYLADGDECGLMQKILNLEYETLKIYKLFGLLNIMRITESPDGTGFYLFGFLKVWYYRRKREKIIGRLFGIIPIVYIFNTGKKLVHKLFNLIPIISRTQKISKWRNN